MLISDGDDVKVGKAIRAKEGHEVTIKGLILQEDKTVLKAKQQCVKLWEAKTESSARNSR